MLTLYLYRPHGDPSEAPATTATSVVLALPCLALHLLDILVLRVLSVNKPPHTQRLK